MEIFSNWDHTHIEICKIDKSSITKNTKVERNQLATPYNATIGVII